MLPYRRKSGSTRHRRHRGLQDALDVGADGPQKPDRMYGIAEIDVCGDAPGDEVNADEIVGIAGPDVPAGLLEKHFPDGSAKISSKRRFTVGTQPSQDRRPALTVPDG